MFFFSGKSDELYMLGQWYREVYLEFREYLEQWREFKLYTFISISANNKCMLIMIEVIRKFQMLKGKRFCVINFSR